MSAINRLIAGLQSRVRFLIGRFGREALLVLTARLLQNANGFLLSVLIVRRFGLASAGTLTVATIAIVVLSLLGTFGLTYGLARLPVSNGEKNALGAFACLIVVPISLPFAAALGWFCGHAIQESLAITLLALGGAFFAQTNIVNALQVLQGRAAHAVIPPLGNLAGLAAACMFGSTLPIFAGVLAGFRFASIALAFAFLPIGRLRLRQALAHIGEGSRFLTADALLMATDQGTIMIASVLMSRPELGLFGLVRQMLTLSDTPAWSQMQAAYPAMVANPQGVFPGFLRRMLVLGIVCAAGVAALTVPLGLLIYHLPRFALLAPLLMTIVPLRYVMGSFDMRLRAMGLIARTNRLSLLRGVLALLIVPVAAWRGGALGGVLATMVYNAIAAWLTARVPIGPTPQPAHQSPAAA
jgi:O-antigen/teichoic acid export membrane protein